MKVGVKVRLVGPNVYYVKGQDEAIDPDNKFYKEGNEGTIVAVGVASNGRDWYDISIPGSAHASLTYWAQEFEVIV